MASAERNPALPRQSKLLYRWFRKHCIRYARRNFHAVRLSRTSAAVPENAGLPLMFVLNHPSWWDVIIGIVLVNRMPAYRHFAPIDAAMLSKYRFFDRLGFFGIEATPRGAARFLKISEAIYEQPYRAMWITAQGKFVDPRVRPIELQPGVGYVASRIRRGLIVPVALEYVFWEERLPEALIRIGEPLPMSTELDGRGWTARIEAALTDTQDALAREAMQRDPALFESLVSGRSGIGGVYDGWRRTKAWLTGKRFDGSHSGKPGEGN